MECHAYLVKYEVDGCIQWYNFDAENEDHAIEQMIDAEPDAFIHTVYLQVKYVGEYAIDLASDSLKEDT
jgi:hypothetical protein